MFRQTKRSSTAVSSEVARHTEYPYRLNLYSAPPLAELTQDEFEQWGLDRLRVLEEIDNCLSLNRTQKEMEATLRPVLQKHMPMSLGAKRNTELERKKDHFSHFILRLAFCKSEELRQKFVRMETHLFRLRFLTDDLEDRRAFMENLDFEWDRLTAAERDQYQVKLVAASGGKPLEENYYKVDFSKVSDLVESRRVFLVGGKAIVPESFQLSLLLTEYSKMLESALVSTSRALPRTGEDERLVPLLQHMADGTIWLKDTADESQVGDKITADMIDGLSEKHFPLCMSTIQRGIRANHHARHGARQQYGLFLKALGLSLDEAIAFWRKSFAPAYDADQFDKKYLYNIRHNYGKVGGRRDYKAMNCTQIANSGTPTAGETHGCPYRYLSPDRLEERLKEMGITNKVDLAEISRLNAETKYYLSCNKVYELTHPNDKTVYTERIMSPNMYFKRSWDTRLAKD